MSSDLLTIVVLFGAALGLIGYGLIPRGPDKSQLRRRIEGKDFNTDPTVIKEKAREAAAVKLVRKAAPMLNRLVMPVSDAEQTQLRQKLMQAGYRTKQSQTVYLASKSALAIFCAISALATASYFGYSMKMLAGMTVAGAGFGFIFPGLWLSSAIRSRQDKIRRGLPDILDLLVVSVEAGLALDTGLKRVGEEMSLVHPDAADEFKIATRETQMGIPRSEALDNLAQRVGIDELRALVSVISQAERFGTSVARALRNQGEAMRTKRRQEAEERAQKTAVKLMIPLVLFIFPAMFVVLAGPAALRLAATFNK